MSNSPVENNTVNMLAEVLKKQDRTCFLIGALMQKTESLERRVADLEPKTYLPAIESPPNPNNFVNVARYLREVISARNASIPDGGQKYFQFSEELSDTQLNTDALLCLEGLLNLRFGDHIGKTTWADLYEKKKKSCEAFIEEVRHKAELAVFAQAAAQWAIRKLTEYKMKSKLRSAKRKAERKNARQNMIGATDDLRGESNDTARIHDSTIQPPRLEPGRHLPETRRTIADLQSGHQIHSFEMSTPMQENTQNRHSADASRNEETHSDHAHKLVQSLNNQYNGDPLHNEGHLDTMLERHSNESCAVQQNSILSCDQRDSEKRPEIIQTAPNNGGFMAQTTSRSILEEARLTLPEITMGGVVHESENNINEIATSDTFVPNSHANMSRTALRDTSVKRRRDISVMKTRGAPNRFTNLRVVTGWDEETNHRHDVPGTASKPSNDGQRGTIGRPTNRRLNNRGGRGRGRYRARGNYTAVVHQGRSSRTNDVSVEK